MTNTFQPESLIAGIRLFHAVLSDVQSLLATGDMRETTSDDEQFAAVMAAMTCISENLLPHFCRSLEDDGGALISRKEAAEILGIPSANVGLALRHGVMVGTKIGGAVRLRLADVLQVAELAGRLLSAAAGAKAPMLHRGTADE